MIVYDILYGGVKERQSWAMSGRQPPGVIGYVVPLSAPPGGSLEFKVSSQGNRPISARALRLICCDPNPDGPGTKTEEADFGLAESYGASEQLAYLGSCAFGPIPPLREYAALKVELIVKPTLKAGFDQTIVSLQNAKSTSGVAVVTRDSALFLRQLDTNTEWDVGAVLPEGRWSRLGVAFDAAGIIVTVSNSPEPTGDDDSQLHFSSQLTSRMLALADHICLAARWRGHPQQTFNGSIERPSLSARRPDPAPSGRTSRGRLLPVGVSPEMPVRRG